jgi:hypothetical protein
VIPSVTCHCQDPLKEISSLLLNTEVYCHVHNSLPASQLKTFSHTIKCIEKQDTMIIEVKNEISKLLDKLNCRKTDFLTTAVRDQLQKLE